MKNAPDEALSRYPLLTILAQLRFASGARDALLSDLAVGDWTWPSHSKHQNVAGVAYHLVEQYAIYATACLAGAHPPYATPPRPRSYPDLARQCAAQARLLLERLAGQPDRRLLRHPAYMVPAATLGAIALSETLLHGWDIADALDRPWQPASEAAAIVLAYLHPSMADSGDSWARLLHVTGRCSEPDAEISGLAGVEWDWELEALPSGAPDASES